MVNNSNPSRFPNGDPIPQTQSEILSWIDMHPDIIESCRKSVLKNKFSVFFQPPAVLDGAKWVAMKTLQIIKWYFRKEKHCKIIAIKSWTNGVPDIFDCTSSAEGRLVFSDGFLNGYTEHNGWKIDIEMETRYSDAAIEDQLPCYNALLMFYTEVLLRTDTAFSVTKNENNILYIQVT